MLASLNLSVRGGNGGNTQLMPDTTGPGGGGGGGLIWFKGNQYRRGQHRYHVWKPGKVERTPSTNFTAAIQRAPREVLTGISSSPSAVSSSIPCPMIRLSARMKFPDRLNALVPMGGSGAFYYKWQQSSNNTSWSDANGPNPINLTNLSATGPDRYHVLSGGSSPTRPMQTWLIPVFMCTVYVHPALNNNLITDDDTVCFNNSPGVLSAPAGMTGGLGQNL